MDKEREHEFESGFSEKALDRAVDQARDLNQVKAGNIFDPKKKISKEKVILDSTSE